MRRRGVEIFSVTDHDTLGAYASDAGLRDGGARPTVVVGVEINTTYRGNEVHILGYRFGDSPEFEEALADNRRARTARVTRIVEHLNRLGVEISFEAVRAEAKGASIGRPHVAMALVRNGYASSVGGAIREMLARDKPAYVPSDHILPQRAIEMIVRAGGVAVLAHPGRLRDYGVIEELTAAGLAGLEVFYPSHDAAQTAYFRGLAHDLGLVMTAGSDFHDQRYNPRGVGADVDPDDLRPFLDLVR